MSSNKMYFIMFDKLDDGWDNSVDFKSSIVGLLRACRDLNLESRSSNKKLRCVPFLRSDIYDCLQYNDKNKAYSDIEFLNWNTDSLKKIINKRISYALECNEFIAWDFIFENKLLAKQTTKFNYMIKRTLLKPRDIIAFCDCSKRQALQRGHELICNDDIYSAEDHYSEYIYREFVDEAHKQYIFIEQLFEVLRGLHYERFSYDDFVAEYSKNTQLNSIVPNNALKILFEYSIIGIERVGGAAGGSKFEFRYTDPLIQPDFKRTMVIHPALKKTLKLVEIRKYGR